jgi:hypothetical protein
MKKLVVGSVLMSLVVACAERKRFRAEPVANCNTLSAVKEFDFHFVVDNSGSNRDTDPSGLRTQSIKQLYEKLKAFEHTIAMQVVSFPHPNRADQGAVIQLPMRSVAEISTLELDQALRFSQRPFGWTPYGDALKESARNLRPTKKSSVIFITDGLPTDEDPDQSLSQIKSLYKDIPIYSLLLVESSSGNGDLEAAWQNNKTDHEKYLASQLDMSPDKTAKNVAMLEAMSEQVDFVRSWAGLEQKLQQIMASRMECQF